MCHELNLLKIHCIGGKKKKNRISTFHGNDVTLFRIYEGDLDNHLVPRYLFDNFEWFFVKVNLFEISNDPQNKKNVLFGVRTSSIECLALLIHWGRETHICVSKVDHHWFRWWLGAWSAPSHYLHQGWDIVSWTLRNKLQWNFNSNSYILIEENAFENIAWKMVAILSRPQCVNSFGLMMPYGAESFGQHWIR